MRLYSAGGCLVVLFFSLPVLAGGVTTASLRADQAALKAAEHDFQARAATLSHAEVTDYQAYIETLRRRLAEHCESVRQAGVEPPGDVACPQAAAIPSPSVHIDQRGERTRAEQTGGLDAELQEGLSGFDEQLLREQARVKAQAPRSAVNSGQAAGGSAGDAGGSGERGAVGTAAGATAGGVARPPGSAGQVGRSAPSRSQPAAYPDGSDDDVVARQLREAAEKETDPALKEKLWEEYRKYKQGTR